MRKITYIILCVLLSLSLVACGQSAPVPVAETPAPTVTPTEAPTPTSEPTPAPEIPSQMDGTWRDEVYREGNSWVQFEVVIDTSGGTVSINSITENARTVMNDKMKISDYGPDYVSAGGYVFTYLPGDVLDVNSALFTNPPLTRYSNASENDAFGTDPNDYRATETQASLSEDEKATLWVLAQQAVKSNLKSPSTAEFPASYGSEGVSFGKTGDTYYVESYVDAQNELGAVVRTDFMVTAHLDGITMVLDDCMIFE